MTAKYKNRVVETLVIRAGDLLKNDGNWRIHPIFQRQALGGLLESVGKIDALKAYRSSRYGGLTLVDGHLRQEFDPDEEWTVLLLDITDDEADLVLAHMDNITKMAETNPLKLDELLERSKQLQSQQLRQASQRLQEAIAAQVAIHKRSMGDPDAPPKPEKAFDYKGSREKSIKVVLPVGEELSIVEKALKKTGERNRGQAMAVICRFYIENHKDKPPK